jgi:hypothetical protein
MEAVASGKHELPRKEGSAHEMNARKCISTVAVKVTDLRALVAEELTRAEIEAADRHLFMKNFSSRKFRVMKHQI